MSLSRERRFDVLDGTFVDLVIGDPHLRQEGAFVDLDELRRVVVFESVLVSGMRRYFLQERVKTASCDRWRCNPHRTPDAKRDLVVVRAAYPSPNRLKNEINAYMY